MDSAIDYYTGQIIDGEQLWHINPVDKHGYRCRGCGVIVNPVSYESHNKKRPHFKDFPSKPHESYCDIEGELKLIAKGREERVTNQNGFPGSFPSNLKLVDEKQKVDLIQPMLGSESFSPGATQSKMLTGKRHTKWTAGTIRPICRMFMNFPYDRGLPLSIPGISGQTYDEVIKKLSSDIISYPTPHIFTAPLSWKKHDNIEGKIIVQLNCGLWEDNKLVKPY